MENTETDLKDSFGTYLTLGIGLCYLGKQDAAEATIAALEVIPEPFKQMTANFNQHLRLPWDRERAQDTAAAPNLLRTL